MHEITLSLKCSNNIGSHARAWVAESPMVSAGEAPASFVAETPLTGAQNKNLLFESKPYKLFVILPNLNTI